MKQHQRIGLNAALRMIQTPELTVLSLRIKWRKRRAFRQSPLNTCASSALNAATSLISASRGCIKIRNFQNQKRSAGRIAHGLIMPLSIVFTSAEKK